MTEKLKQTIKNELAKLPKENQEAINSCDWVKMSEEIGEKYLLSESEINDFQVETLLVLVGLEEPDLYTIHIENNVGTTKDEAKKIAEEVLQKIFTPINDILIEKIKKSGKDKNANAEQSLDFILSGGDYSAFMSPTQILTQVGTEVGKEKKPSTPVNVPTLADIKANAQKTNMPIKPTKMEDIKSKFTI